MKIFLYICAICFGILPSFNAKNSFSSQRELGAYLDSTVVFKLANPPSTKSTGRLVLYINKARSTKKEVRLSDLSITVMEGINDNGVLKTRALVSGSIWFYNLPGLDVLYVDLQNNLGGSIHLWEVLKFNKAAKPVRCGQEYPFQIQTDFDMALYKNSYQVRIFNKGDHWYKCN
jgi:hypothetical protein